MSRSVLENVLRTSDIMLAPGWDSQLGFPPEMFEWEGGVQRVPGVWGSSPTTHEEKNLSFKFNDLFKPK